ncbi:MAG TPA: AraC family transcriptional regulator [Tepidisphaeraceae bacterium]|nr:AraC family transcriptional regulator [Tepidisphaeraceae bacterium]
MPPRYTVRQNTVQLAADTPLRTQVLQVPRDVPPHDHDYYEICIVTGGRATHQTEQYDAVAPRGTVIVVPPGEVHAFADVRNFAVINVYYLTEWLLADLRRFWDEEGLVPLFLAHSLFRLERGSIPQFDLTREELDLCQGELRDIAAETASGRCSRMYLRAAFVKFLILLSRAFARQSAPDAAFRFRPQVWKALQYVERAVMESEPFSVQALSAELNTSPDHTTRLFKSATGFPPMEYFQQRRVQHAGLLLLNPQTRITEVAYALGYADAAHLSRMFRRYRGISPRQYRSMYVK